MSRLHRPFFVSLLVATGAFADPAIRFANGVSCHPEAAHFQLDMFDSAKTASQTVIGGNWYPYTDPTSSKAVDSLMGASHLDLLAGKTWAPWNLGQIGYGAVRATLEKNVAGVYHKNAGWVRLATSFYNDLGERYSHVPVAGITAISFKLFVGSAGGKLPDSLRWDPERLPYVSLRLSVIAQVGDAVYSIKIPVEQGVGNAICVDFDSLKQEGDQIDSIPWDPTYRIKEVAFETRIADRQDSSLHSAGPVTFAVNDVELYGQTMDDLRCLANDWAPVCGPENVKGRSNSTHSLRATYSNDLTISYTFPGTSAQLDILRLDGSRVARLQVPAHASNMHLSQRLARGTYMLALRGEGATQVVPLTVAR